MRTATQEVLRFDGPALKPLDTERLGEQQRKVEQFMLGAAGWVTLAEVAHAIGAPEQSVSARLRTMRKRGHVVDRKRAAPGRGLWLYRVRTAGWS